MNITKKGLMNGVSDGKSMSKKFSVFTVMFSLVLVFVLAFSVVSATDGESSSFSLWDWFTNFFSSGNESSVTGAATLDSADCPSSIVSLWLLDGSAVDVIGGNDGSSVTPYIWSSSGLIDGALDVNDDANSVSLPASASLDFAGDMAISVWVYPRIVSGYDGILTKRSALSNSQINYWMDLVNGKPRFLGQNGAGAVSSSTIPVNTWTHLVGVRQGTTYTLYINGALDSTGSASGIVNTNIPVAIGRFVDQNGYHFDGLMDEVMIFGSTLDVAEIQMLYDEGLAGSSICAPEFVCGNGVVEFGEECDDGNVLSGDGCSAICEIEISCGNGVVELGEECDDGNLINDDGCSDTCNVELLDCSPNMVGYWTFDNADTSGSIASDVVNGYDGAIVGATSGVAGKLGEAYRFDGSNDEVVFTGLSDSFTSTGFTFATWLRFTGTGANGYLGPKSDTGEGTNRGITLTIDDYNGAQSIRINSPYDGIFSSNGIVVNVLDKSEWHHVVVVRTLTDFSAYVDGVYAGVIAANGIYDSASDWRVGHYNNDNNLFFKGDMDEIVLFNRPLTPAEAQALYSNTNAGYRYCDTPLCGNGIVDLGEERDDGNVLSGDGCSDICIIELQCVDNDSDGYGVEGGDSCTHSGIDCDDANAAVNPGATEVCNGIDDNCDELVDEGFSVGVSCISTPNNCGDTNEGIYVCNILGGSDCNAIAPADRPADVAYADVDGDGYGSTPVDATCGIPLGAVTNNLDCDDANAAVNPGATEVCNGIDDNCDELVDEGFSVGVSCISTPNNCGDTNEGIYVCNILGGSDCNAIAPADRPADVAYADVDGDGYGSTPVDATCGIPLGAVTNNLDCDDANAAVNPGATEVCNGIDDNCDELVDDVDNDNDGMNDCNGEDKCLDTTSWFASQSLNPNHYDGSNWIFASTYGCSCEQVLHCKPGQNAGEFKFGCTEGTLDVWTTQTGWAPDCQENGNGFVVREGEAKSLFEDTDNAGMIDLFDADNDNDGVPDNEDSEIDSKPDATGKPKGKPDWWCDKNPAKC